MPKCSVNKRFAMSEDVTKAKTLIETLALGTKSFELCGFKESLFACYIAGSLLYCELSLTLLKKFFCTK